MPNSFINSMTDLSVNTLTTGVGSLFFYGSNNDNSRLVPATVMQTFLGYPLSTFIYVTSANQSINVNVRTHVQFDTAERDPLGVFNTASVGYIWPNFDGWARVRFGLQYDSGGALTQQYEVRKNGSGFPGCAFGARWVDWNPSECKETAPFQVTSGDDIHLSVRPGNSNTIRGTINVTWLEFQPLALWT